MFIFGGTYQETFLDPTVIPIEEAVMNYDMDASTFQ
jgi:hypothetical protein